MIPKTSQNDLRLVLAILVILARNAYFLVEQPSQSLLYLHHRWQWLANIVAYASSLHMDDMEKIEAVFTMSNEHVRPGSQVFEVKFWMMHWGSASPKRTVFMGNLVAMTFLNRGKLTNSEKKKKHKVKTTRTLFQV